MAHNKPAEAPGCYTAEGTPSECARPTGPQVVCAHVCPFFRPWTLQSDFQAQVLHNTIYDFSFYFLKKNFQSCRLVIQCASEKETLEMLLNDEVAIWRKD